MANLSTPLVGANPLSSTYLSTVANSNVNMANPEQLLEQQQRYFQYSAEVNFCSTVLKLYKDMILGIIAKI